MAGKEDDDLIVNVDDLDTIAVNVEDNPDLAKEPEKKVEAKPAKEPKPKRVLLDDQQIVPNADHEKALEDAKAFGKQQEEARRAAEATANSERMLREQAQTRAQQAQQEAEQLRERANDSELAIIDNGIASAQKELEAHEAEYTRAAESGEFAKMASIQTKLSKAAAALDRLEAAKSTFDVRKTQTTEGRVEAPQPTQASAFEQYLSQFAPAAQTWLRQHPDCVPSSVGGDSTKNSKMMAGHYGALAQNIQPNTTEYFTYLDNHLNPTQQAQPVIQEGVTSKAAEVVTAGETKPAPKHLQVAAPPSRDTPSASGQQQRNVREVRLTRDQQEMAKVSFPHLPEAQAYGQYARNLIELEAEGKIGRSTH